jgi:curved DNA-binding protein CbpA
MEPGITWYEVLGVLPGVQPEKIRQKYDERTHLLRSEMIAGAPSNVLTAVGRARNFLDTAWEILGDPASRNRYDEAAGFRRKGLAPSGSFATSSWHDSADSAVVGDMGGDALAGLLELGGFVGGGPRRPSKVPVPDVQGLFYDVAGSGSGSGPSSSRPIRCRSTAWWSTRCPGRRASSSGARR